LTYERAAAGAAPAAPGHKVGAEGAPEPGLNSVAEVVPSARVSKYMPR